MRSPFARVIALDWYDGPRAGLLACGQCGREYHFEWRDERSDEDGGRDVRVFTLAALPWGSVARLAAALAPGQVPRWPVWVPLWRFPSEGEEAAMNQLTDQILRGAGPPEWAIATADPAGEVLAARAVRAEDLARVQDWFAFLGLDRAHVGG